MVQFEEEEAPVEMVDASFNDSLSNLEEMRFSAPADAQQLFPGMLVEHRYTVQHKLGAREGWDLYQVIDQLSAKLWLLKLGPWRPDVDRIVESNHIGLIAPNCFKEILLGSCFLPDPRIGAH